MTLTLQLAADASSTCLQDGPSHGQLGQAHREMSMGVMVYRGASPFGTAIWCQPSKANLRRTGVSKE